MSTPEFQLAPLPARSLALLADVALCALATVVLAAPFGGVVRAVTLPGYPTPIMLGDYIGLVVGAVYFVSFWVVRSQTPAMALAKIRVVDQTSGQPLTVVHGLIRFFGGVLSVACVFLGLLAALVDPRHQGWHDRWAKSLVVREPRH